MRNSFKIVREFIKKEWTDLKLNVPKEPRKMKLPLKYDESVIESFTFIPESKYNQVYKAIIDHFWAILKCFFINPKILP